jgi:hypothetical protein
MSQTVTVETGSMKMIWHEEYFHAGWGRYEVKNMVDL